MDSPRSLFHNVTEYLSWDHDGQEDVLLEARDALDGGDLVLAASRFDVYQERLLRHMRLEERILFPLVETLTPQAALAVTEMRHEHAVVRRYLATMRTALLASEVERFRHALDELGLILLAHEAREERLVYPVLDRSLSPEQRADLATRLAHEH
jgi:iron-sulfur cluster repair protein YtfE (RIC family)